MLALVRHAGYQLSTGEIDSQGVSDSQSLAKKLAVPREPQERLLRGLKAEWRGLISSPVLRAKQTAEAMGQILGLKTTLTADLGLEGDPEGFVAIDQADWVDSGFPCSSDQLFGQKVGQVIWLAGTDWIGSGGGLFN